MTWSEYMVARLVLFVARLVAEVEKPELVPELRNLSNALIAGRRTDES